MTTGISPNFEEHWEGANVILRTQNSNGKELHANKETLGDNSSYFHAMFFSGFKEAHENIVEIQCDYEHMLKILRTIDKTNISGCLLGVSSEGDLVEMYRIADMLDFPNIRNMFYANRITNFRVDFDLINRLALKLNNHDILANFLDYMTVHELKEYVKEDGIKKMFCKQDIALVLKKFDQTILSEEPNKETSLFEFKEPDQTDDMELQMLDVTVNTKNSDGRPIRTNREFLASKSKYFRDLLAINNRSICVDVDYVTMKTVIYVLRSYYCYSPAATLHPILLYDMYRFAKKFQQHSIELYTATRLVKQATAGCLEVALKLDSTFLKHRILAKMLPSDLRDWVLSGDEDLVYTEDGKENRISSRATDPVFSLNDLRPIVSNLCARYEGCDYVPPHLRNH